MVGGRFGVSGCGASVSFGWRDSVQVRYVVQLLLNLRLFGTVELAVFGPSAINDQPSRADPWNAAVLAGLRRSRWMTAKTVLEGRR